ncbi:outer membrane protein TolC [Methylovirgula ligni]|uniref:Outer membrane protein TolC n=1 Tax=Methylovirgula ligni TaxID=569860 RepID=A0A3D9YMW2_9HYPH|nr:TolC family protein [Methylovirgula ligni]REF83318.1 outer membrane protein TolC [Methylovirgula ligni]
MAILAGILASSCVRDQPVPLSPAVSAAALESRSLSDPRLRQFVLAATRPDAPDDAPIRWDLASLTAAALYYHPDIALAEAKLAAARAAVITAKQTPNPVLNLTNIVGQSVVPGGIPAGAAPLTIGPAIDLVIDTFGRKEARTAEAERLEQAARWDLATAAWQVRSRVRAALLALWAAERRMALTRQRLALQNQLVELLEHRQAAGEVSSLDVSRERVNRAQIILAQHDLDLAVAEAHVRLAIAIGVPDHTLDGIGLVTGVFDYPPGLGARADSDLWRREALTRRPDIQASLAAYAASEATLNLAVAGQYPDLALSPGYSYQYGVNQYQLNVLSTLPIFNQNQGAIAEAVARRQEAAASFIGLQAQVIGEIDQATVAYRKSTQTLASANALQADERHRAEAMEKSFAAGQADRPTLVSTQMEAAVTALANFDALLQQREALGSLEDALERPLYGPEILLALPQAPLPPQPRSAS